MHNPYELDGRTLMLAQAESRDRSMIRLRVLSISLIMTMITVHTFDSFANRWSPERWLITWTVAARRRRAPVGRCW